MRRLYRSILPIDIRVALHKEGTSVTSSEEARARWKSFRGTTNCRAIQNALGAMSGTRQRCSYCSDSHASDIDHFIPMATDYSATFRWPNMLWVCARCNRTKGMRFPVDSLGAPLLINPTSLDPWAKLTLDQSTGIISARFRNGSFDVMGEATLKILPTINYEAVAEGRLRIINRLDEVFQKIVQNGDTSENRSKLGKSVREDDMGISRWLAFWDGQQEPVVQMAKIKAPSLWRRFLRMCESCPENLAGHVD